MTSSRALVALTSMAHLAVDVTVKDPLKNTRSIKPEDVGVGIALKSTKSAHSMSSTQTRRNGSLSHLP